MRRITGINIVGLSAEPTLIMVELMMTIGNLLADGGHEYNNIAFVIEDDGDSVGEFTADGVNLLADF